MTSRLSSTTSWIGSTIRGWLPPRGNRRERLPGPEGGQQGDGRPLPTKKHRADLQGLRAVAVLLVVLNHAHIGVFTGGYVGVDVFFVLSGFLITGLLLAGVEKHGRVVFSDFYIRRARRILPAAALTLVAIDLVVYQIVNFVRAKPIVWDSIWASFFAANIHFANVHTDYFARAQRQPPSPILHFWSLAVEEQFYLVWPTLIALVLLGVTLVGTRRRDAKTGLDARHVRGLFIAIVALSVLSFAWSIYDTQTDPQAAYFSAFTRAWELGLGAGLAIGVAALRRLPAFWSGAMGWAGAAAIVVAGIAFSSGTAFPGYAAALPVVGAALVIAAGSAVHESRWGVGRVLALRPFGYVGDRSYAFYLWHWPVLVLALIYVGHGLSGGSRLLLLLGAFLLSIVSYALYENPIRHVRSRPLGALLWPACVGTVVIVGAITLNAIAADASRFEATGTRPQPGQAQTFLASSTRRQRSHVLPAVIATVKAAKHGAGIPGGLHPPVDKLSSDHYLYPSGCEPPLSQTTSKICKLGSPSSKRSIVVIGDSHVQIWMPALLKMAKRDGWDVRPIGHSGCNPARWLRTDQGLPQCQTWFKWAVKSAQRLHPTVTMIGGADAPIGHPVSDGGRASAHAISWTTRAMKPYSKHVIVIGDTPVQKQVPVDCLTSKNATLLRCSTTPTWSQLYRYIATQAKFDGAGFLNTRLWLCYQGVCPMVVGRTIAYVDTAHISMTYARELARPFRKAFTKALQTG